MRIRIGNGLLPLGLLVLALVAVILLFPFNILRIILGVPFLIFFPGYALMAALFPGRDRIDGIERVAISFAASIAVVPLIGYILNFTPWGIRLEPVLYSAVLFIFITSIIGWLRRRRLPEQQRFNVEFQLGIPGRGEHGWQRMLPVILAVTILGVFGTLGYVIANPKVRERFTEFYVVGLSGKATDYPGQIQLGKEGKVIAGIVNHEHEVVNYRIEFSINGVKNNEVKVGPLADEQRWEEIVSFVPDQLGDHQKVEFRLYKNGKVEPDSKSLYFWIDVTE